MFPFSRESFDLHIDKRNILLWKKVLLVAEKQGDLVDNNANFCRDCVILSLPPKAACIAVLSSLDESLSAHPEVELPNVSPSLWNAKLCIRGITDYFCFSEVHWNVSVNHWMFFLLSTKWKILLWYADRSTVWKLSSFLPHSPNCLPVKSKANSILRLLTFLHSRSMWLSTGTGTISSLFPVKAGVAPLQCSQPHLIPIPNQWSHWLSGKSSLSLCWWLHSLPQQPSWRGSVT